MKHMFYYCVYHYDCKNASAFLQCLQHVISNYRRLFVQAVYSHFGFLDIFPHKWNYVHQNIKSGVMWLV